MREKWIWSDEGNFSKERLIAQEYIVAGLRRGLSATRITRLLREHGVSYRRSNMFKDIKRWRDYLEHSKRMRYINKDKIIPEEYYIPTSFIHGAKYETVMRYEGFDELTGEKIEGYITIKHLHEYMGHIGPDVIQTLTPGDLTNHVIEVLNTNYAMNVVLERCFPVMGFVNTELM